MGQSRPGAVDGIAAAADRAVEPAVHVEEQVLEAALRHQYGLDGGIAARSDHRAWSGCAAQPHAVAEVEPARLGPEVECEHSVVS